MPWEERGELVNQLKAEVFLEQSLALLESAKYDCICQVMASAIKWICPRYEWKCTIYHWICPTYHCIGSNITGFVLNMTELVLNMTGIFLIMTIMIMI